MRDKEAIIAINAAREVREKNEDDRQGPESELEGCDWSGVPAIPGEDMVDFGEVGGSGGSMTSASVSTGEGATAGGRTSGANKVRRSPGRTGSMYFGMSLPRFRHGFSASIIRM